MNSKQKQALDISLSGHNLLLLGSAGTGKSYLVKEIAKQLMECGKTVQMTCSTGIACQVYADGVVDAITIHQFTGISDGRYGPADIINVLINNRKYESVVEKIKKCDVLIVDECSMISSKTFDTINKACSMRNTEQMFGGMQVIFVGDFFQLPPVANFNYEDDGSYCFTNSLFNTVFPHRIILHVNIRQHEAELINAINEIYSGNISANTQTYIYSLSRPIEPRPTHTVKLFAKNELVDNYNRQCLIEHPGQMYEFSAVDTGLKYELDKFTAPKILWLKKSVPVMLLRNLNNILVNGLQGTVHDIDENGITVYFRSLNITTRILKVKFTVYNPAKQRDTAMREQYPLKPCFGLTIHKSQGMSLDSVEIDCREIFKAGQLGVALSRAINSAGLRVINFHKRYVIPPTHQVMEFMQFNTDVMVSEHLSCCRKELFCAEAGALVNPLSVDCYEADVEQPSVNNCGPYETEIDESILDDDDEDDEFNQVIASITLDECQDYEVPDAFDLKLHKFEKEITLFHTNHNNIVSNIDKGRLNVFVKKVFMKLSVFKIELKVKENEPTAIPEKEIAEFYRKVHAYSTSSEYKLNCLILFENDDNFYDVHQGICYNVLEAVRLFFLKQKAAVFKRSERKVTKREVTDASKARVRYVAGYCIAKIRKKYIKMKKSNMYSTSEQGQAAYESAKCTVSIMNVLKEEKHFLQASTSEPESLLDINRRQNLSRGLTNVSDSLYHFFITLTDKILCLLVNDNFIRYGKTMYAACLEQVKVDRSLYEICSSIVIHGMSSIHEETHSDKDLDNINMKSFVVNMVLVSSQILVIFDEIAAKYMLVLFAQFRKDMKSALQIEKTMAHRKQIKIHKQKCSVEKKGGTGMTESKAPAEEPQAGTSGIIRCKQCKSDHENDEWIQCDSCDLWLHRICAGLKHASKWKKYSKENIQWICTNCSKK